MAESRRDFGLDVGGSGLLCDDVGQQVDEHLVVLQQRHRAVLPVEMQVPPHRPDGHVHLTRVLTLAGLHGNGTWKRGGDEVETVLAFLCLYYI